MFNKLVLAAAVAVPLGVLGLSGQAMAGYSPTSHTPIARTPLRMTEALSCAAVGRIVRADGYRNVTARDCDGRTYVFHAMHNGRSVVLHVNSRNGHIRGA